MIKRGCYHSVHYEVPDPVRPGYRQHETAGSWAGAPPPAPWGSSPRFSVTRSEVVCFVAQGRPGLMPTWLTIFIFHFQSRRSKWLVQAQTKRGGPSSAGRGPQRREHNDGGRQKRSRRSLKATRQLSQKRAAGEMAGRRRWQAGRRPSCPRASRAPGLAR